MTPKIPPSAATPSPTQNHVSLDMARTVRRARTIRKLPMVALALILTLGCGAADKAYTAGKVAALECGKLNLAPAAALLARWGVEDALAGKIDWAKHEADAAGFALGVGTCAYAEARRAYKAKPTVQAMALGEQPDDGSAGLARLANGAQVVLADGTVVQ